MIKYCCDEMAKNLDAAEVDIRYDDKFREYGIGILNGGTAKQSIHFCPWCGTSLPISLRENWFDLIFDEYNLDGPDDPGLPEEMKSGEWWRSRRL